MKILIDKKSVKKNPDYMQTHHRYDSGQSTINITLSVEYNQEFVNENQCNRYYERFSHQDLPNIMNVKYTYTGLRKQIENISDRIFKLNKNNFVKNSYMKYSLFKSIQSILAEFIILEIRVCDYCENEMQINHDIRIINSLPDTRKYLYKYKNMTFKCPCCKQKIKTDELIHDYIETSEFYSEFHKCPLCDGIINDVEYENIEDLTGMEAGLSG